MHGESASKIYAKRELSIVHHAVERGELLLEILDHLRHANLAVHLLECDEDFLDLSVHGFDAVLVWVLEHLIILSYCETLYNCSATQHAP